MSNHTKWKSSSFLKNTLYPETMLSKHKHARKSGYYARLKRQYLLAYSSSLSSLLIVRDSKILLQSVPQVYLQYLPTDQKGEMWERNMFTKSSLITSSRRTGKRSEMFSLRGLQEMGEFSQTNGLLGSGYRYFCVQV